MKKILTATIVLIGLCMSSVIISAEPVVEDVTIDPEEPKAMDTITITVTIDSTEEIEEVTLRIKECDESMCMPTQSYPMEFENGKYTVTDELTYTAATYFGYQLIITSNGNVTYYPNSDDSKEFQNVTLKPADNGGTNGGNGGDGNGDNGLPGFELVPLFVATLIIIFYLRRKRSR